MKNARSFFFILQPSAFSLHPFPHAAALNGMLVLPPALFPTALNTLNPPPSCPNWSVKMGLASPTVIIVTGALLSTALWLAAFSSRRVRAMG